MTVTADLVHSETTGNQFTYLQNAVISSLTYDVTSISDGVTSLSWSVVSTEGFAEYTNISPTQSYLQSEITTTPVIENSQTPPSLHSEAATTHAIENFRNVTTSLHFESYSQGIPSPQSMTENNIFPTSTQNENISLSSVPVQNTTYGAASTDTQTQMPEMQGKVV